MIGSEHRVQPSSASGRTRRGEAALKRAARLGTEVARASRHRAAVRLGRRSKTRTTILGDALAGDPSRFARQDDEAWRIVGPALDPGAPPHAYDAGTWGPPQAEGLVPGGWVLATT